MLTIEYAGSIAASWHAEEGFLELVIVLGTSVALIFIALAVQFQNAIKPFLVFGAIPYGMVGAMMFFFMAHPVKPKKRPA